MAFHSFEHNTINDVAESDDQDHHRDDGAHIVQVAAHHQNLAEAETQVKHFGGDQRAPGKGPALLETGNDEGKAGGQQDVPEQLESFCAEVASGLTKDFGHLLAAIFHREGDGQQGTHDHDEEDGILAEPEPEQCERPPADAREALQTDEQSSHGFFEEFIAGDAESEDHPKDDGNGVANHNPLHADANGDPVAVILKSGVQSLADSPRRWKKIWRPDFQFGEKRPKPKENRIENQVAGGAFHDRTPSGIPAFTRGFTPSLYSASRERLISSRSSSRI